MRTDYPIPWNPERLPDADPGYRYLGANEVLRLDDQVDSNRRGKWETRKSIGGIISRVSDWTYRRALSIDDPNAPPPNEFCHPNWVIVTEPTHGDRSLQWWNKDVWQQCGDGCAFSDHFYYRRPIATSAASPMNTSSSAPIDWIAFSTCLPTDAEAAAGIWTVDMRSATPHADLSKYCPGFFAMSFGARTHWKPGADAYPALPKPTLPPAPMLDGVGKVYKMTYTKGDNVVTFGCAKLSIKMLAKASELTKERGDGNRVIQSVTLDSGVPINASELNEILDYVRAVGNEP